jgi:hypothetical protein
MEAKVPEIKLKLKERMDRLHRKRSPKAGSSDSDDAKVEKDDAKVEKDGRPRALSRQDLRVSSSRLRRSSTRGSSFEGPTEEEMKILKEIYDSKKDDLDALAAMFDIKVDLLKNNAPEDGEQFAKFLFLGFYTEDKTEASKAEVRRSLNGDIKRTQSKLRKSVTKASIGPASEDIAAAAKVYTELDGDLAKIAERCLLTFQLMQNDPPVSADDFAVKAFAGNYTEDKDEALKSKLRHALGTSIRRVSTSLKKSTTKEPGGLSQQDIDMTAKLFPASMDEVDGVAEKLGLSVALLKANPPTDDKDFARKVLTGFYTEAKESTEK